MFLLIKYTCLLAGCFLLFPRLLHLGRRCISCSLAAWIMSFLIAAAYLWIRRSSYVGSTVLMISTVILCCLILYRQTVGISMMTVVFSLSGAYIAHTLGLVLALVPYVPVTLILSARSNITFPYEPLDIVYILTAGLFEILLIYALFYRGRLVNGMPFLKFFRGSWGGAVLGFVVIFTAFLASMDPMTDNRFLLFGTAAIESAVFLILWWREKLIIRFNTRIRDANVEALERENSKLKAEMQRVLDDNFEMARMMHTETKVVAGIEADLLAFLEAFHTDDLSSDNAKQLIDRLHQILQDQDVQTAIYHADADSIPPTGLPSLDAVIRLMTAKAKKAGAELTVTCQADFAMSFSDLSEAHVAQIVADLLDNAVIATESVEVKKVDLTISQINETWTISVKDTGVQFPVHLMSKIGVVPVTTHEDSGGSGMGMMSIIHLISITRASLYIDQKSVNQPYAKEIRVVFDHAGDLQLLT